MKTEIILWTILPLVVVFPGCSALQGDSNAVCSKAVSYYKSYKTAVPVSRRTGWWIFGSTKYETQDREQWQTAWKTEEVCCSGYENVYGTCKPKCSSTCENGYCAAPNTCRCDTGYAMSVTETKLCVPVCDRSCVNGKCVRPNTCICNTGYELNADGHTCEPVCTDECEHGFCERPNICACSPGYEMDEDNKCSPVCDQKCVNGECVNPNVCACNNDFQLSQENIYTCEPKCSEPCVFGKCIAPDTCACDDGYEFTLQSMTTCEPICLNCENGNCTEPNYCDCFDGYIEFIEPEFNGSSCKPWCNDSCINGNCTAPNICTCNPGFQYNSTTTDCDPVCIEPCVNGFCESPETCQCFEGYVQNSVNSTTCEAVCENCDNGTCVAPDECVCNDGFSKDETNDGTCIPSCEPGCIHGTCVIGGCDCLYGWRGNSCEEPLLCVITQLVPVNLTEAVGKLPDFNDSKDTTENSYIEWEKYVTTDSPIVWDGPVCHSRCLDQLNTTSVNFTEYSTDVIHHFVPIDSSCNFVSSHLSFLEKRSFVLASVLGIAFLALIIGAVYTILQRKRRGKYTTNDDSGLSVCKVDTTKAIFRLTE